MTRYGALQEALVANPEAGDVIPGSGGSCMRLGNSEPTS